MKYFLLIAGDTYYPSHATGDWIGTYLTLEEAQDQISEEIEHVYFTKGPRKGQIKEIGSKKYRIKDRGDDAYDWYEIIDLREWIL